MASLTAAARSRRTAAVGLWAVLVGAAHLYGDHLQTSGTWLYARFPPLFARLEPHLNLRIVGAVAVAAVVAWWGPPAAKRAPWPIVVLASILAAGAFSVALAASDGWATIALPVTSPHEYLVNVSRVGDPGLFLSTFAERLPRYTVHVQGHPPAMLLLLWAMQRVGLSGPEPAAALMIAVGASAVGAVMVTVREIASEKAARTIAPYLVLLPAAVWIATSADAFYMGLGAWGIAVFALATGRTTPIALWLAAASGLILGSLLFFSYGAVPLAIFVIVLAVNRRSIGQFLAASVGVAIVAAGFALAGFWWLDGLNATLVQYRAGVGGLRPQSYFGWANLATFAIVTGPAVAAGLSGLRDRKSWLLVGSACVAVLASTLSSLSKAEVERIWLGFAIWMPVACVSLPTTRRTATFWLSAQAALGILLQVALKTPW